MVELVNVKRCVVKHFAIDEEHAFVQYSLTMSEDDFKAITTPQGGANTHIGSKKILVQALDISGSMYGQPMDALKKGAQLMGDKYFASEEPPFEKFITILHDHEIQTFEAESHEQYKARIARTDARGGNNFMNVFVTINKILDENPNTEELICVFVTDGQDCDPGHRSEDPNADYLRVSQELKARPNLRTKFLSVGFSRNHDAAFMNKIANFGSEMGNFVYIDTSDR